ncbi:MAG: putative toxin-antitoxin system toxin component, PIN family [Anaerolinea sp.]|nr:putative toxin-antitoxin system toxin component, PIN family [Anaerolinea sp.]
MRVVFDTNTVISAQFWRGAPRQALDAIRAQCATLIASETLLTELALVLARSKFAQRLMDVGTTAETIMAEHRALIEIVEPVRLSARISDDPKDDMILACALGGQADCIVSGDDDLLRLGSIEEIPIWTVNHFLEVIKCDES